MVALGDGSFSNPGVLVPTKEQLKHVLPCAFLAPGKEISICPVVIDVPLKPTRERQNILKQIEVNRSVYCSSLPCRRI